MASIDQMAQHFGDNDYPQLEDTVKYDLKNIVVCIIKEQCSDQEESK